MCDIIRLDGCLQVKCGQTSVLAWCGCQTMTFIQCDVSVLEAKTRAERNQEKKKPENEYDINESEF